LSSRWSVLSNEQQLSSLNEQQLSSSSNLPLLLLLGAALLPQQWHRWQLSST
jgi:hypothetical protein